MREIVLNSHAKINLSLEVGEVRSDGMHPVDTVMQKLDLSDLVKVRIIDEASPEEGNAADHGIDNRDERISITAYGPELGDGLPTDRRNLAYRVCELMIEEFGREIPSELLGSSIEIELEKNIPIAAGLAGGSGNAAAVMAGLSILWNLTGDEERLLRLAGKLGADIPFCLSKYSSARGRGTGAELTPCSGVKCYAILAKPDIEVSTKEVYIGIDSCEVRERPNNDRLDELLRADRYEEAASEMINVLENYTLYAKEEVSKLKEEMEKVCEGAFKVLMSGSGPTVFALFRDKEKAQGAFEKISALGYNSFLCETIQ